MNIIHQQIVRDFPPSTGVVLTEDYTCYKTGIEIPKGTIGTTTGNTGEYQRRLNAQVTIALGAEIELLDGMQVVIPVIVLSKKEKRG